MKKTLIVGLGNPILGDDGVGWRVAELVADRLGDRPAIDITCLGLGGLSLMENMVGYQRAIIIDAIQTGSRPQGAVMTFDLAALPDHSAGHTTAAHDTSLQTALSLGRTMGAELPDEVMIVGIEAEQVYDFSEELTPTVADAVPIAAEAVFSLLTDPVQQQEAG